MVSVCVCVCVCVHVCVWCLEYSMSSINGCRNQNKCSNGGMLEGPHYPMLTLRGHLRSGIVVSEVRRGREQVRADP